MHVHGSVGRTWAHPLRQTSVKFTSDRQTAIRSAAADARARTLPVPTRPSEQCVQAAAAVEAAWKSGCARQRVELLLPLIGATDLDDWPGGVRQQFKAIQPLVEQMLRTLKQVEGLQGALVPELWDDGDAVACYRSANFAAVIFPTASTLDKLRQLAEGPTAPKLLIIINPQWESQGNLVSDFGIGPWRAQREAFVATFSTTYWLRQQRVYGDIVRVLHAHPGQWQVHRSSPTSNANECISTQAALPTYAEIEALLRARPDSSINKSVMQRLQEEWEFNRKSMDQQQGPRL
ncbi:hypothetical protein V8C86DRAFT_2654345 [Haematococcus lacustris]